MSPAQKLRALLDTPGLLVMPCCFDALSARLIEQAGFSLTFMSGFAVSAARLGAPDTGLISYGEMVDQARAICAAVSIPVIGDGDTGYGNAMNVKRTARGYAQAGLACVMIEDQVAPKRCGHTRGKQVVPRDEAFTRVQAAVDARDEGAGVLVMARTDARQTHGFEEALSRAKAFADLGADIVFLEAPESVEEMRAFCREVRAPTMANMLDHGKTPVLPPAELAAIGYKIAAYPLTLLSVAAAAMRDALSTLRGGGHPDPRMSFEALQGIVGFPEYYAEEERYAKPPASGG
ncbi:isocitrate lyase/PEP mutase family protein [Sorangium sp. So ce131]|uniref:isocitrate lyase/PEP mutase family protein n=1 Tax=Sorangium sp. So ce131 TaxID=3133282 RepID=UPI003F5D8CD8